MPPMVGGIFYEHGHRMIASFVGLLSIILAVWLWRVESRRPPGERWLRWLGVAALGAVIAQGLLGGLTVLFFLPPRGLLRARHPGAAFLRTVASIALFTSAWWERDSSLRVPDLRSPSLHALAVATASAVLLQLILGAAFRHKAFGIVPHLVRRRRRHRADLLAGGRAAAAVSPACPELRFAARGLHALIGLQLLLGGAAWWSRLYAAQFPQPIPVMVTLTVCTRVTGALVLVTTSSSRWSVTASCARRRLSTFACAAPARPIVSTSGI